METRDLKCKIHGITKHTDTKDKYYRCNKCASESVIDCRKRRKELLVQYRGGKCDLCEYDRCSSALEFHHINPKEKEFGLSASHRVTISLKRQLVEVQKCMLLCSNCHRELHEGIVEIPTTYKQTICEEYLVKEKKIFHKICPQCTKEYDTVEENQKYCSHKCFKISLRKCERPSLKTLENDVETLGYCGTGRKYDVSDNTIRKWIKNYKK